MGFLLDLVGSMAGSLAAQGKEMEKYKSEYETMSDTNLEQEFLYLKGKEGTEHRLRFMAVRSVLQDRGYEL